MFPNNGTVTQVPFFIDSRGLGAIVKRHRAETARLHAIEI